MPVIEHFSGFILQNFSNNLLQLGGESLDLLFVRLLPLVRLEFLIQLCKKPVIFFVPYMFCTKYAHKKSPNKAIVLSSSKPPSGNLKPRSCNKTELNLPF